MTEAPGPGVPESVMREFYRYTPEAKAAAWRRMTEVQRDEIRRLERLARGGWR